MLKVTTEQLKGLNAEGVACLLLSHLKEADPHRFNFHANQLSSILGWLINPIWRGENVQNGVLVGSGSVGTYAPKRPDAVLQARFTDAAELLKKLGLARQMPGQSADFLEVTDEGRKHTIDTVDLTLDLPREPAEFFERFSPSVFRVESTTKEGDPTNGTCFLIRGGLILTASHNLVRPFGVFLEEGTRIGSDDFDRFDHLTEHRDLSVLQFKSERMRKMVEDLLPLKLCRARPRIGTRVIAIGFPAVPQRTTAQTSATGSVQSYTAYYSGKLEYLTTDAKITPGFSGGPIFDDRGRVGAVVTESTESGSLVYNHGIPIEELSSLFDAHEEREELGGILRGTIFSR